MNAQEDFYQSLREKMRGWLGSEEGKKNKFAEYLMFGPDLFHLLCKLALDSEVPMWQKAKLAGAIAYFVAPADMLPELITGPVGFVDDIALASLVLDGVVNKTEPSVVEKHWAGSEDVLALIRRIIRSANDMVGSGRWRKLRRRF